MTTDRAVEVLHDRGPAARPRWTVGSGFLIHGRRVLTAAHNVGDGQILVRVKGRAEYPATVVVSGREGPDLAVLEITDEQFRPDASEPPVTWARVDRRSGDMVAPCWAVGFPAFKERKEGRSASASGRHLRDTAHLHGQIAPGANSVSGLLELQVTASPRPLPAGAIGGSVWQGISGSVVFAGHPTKGDVAVGVVVQHHLPEGDSALTVVPITSVEGSEHARTWWSVLGVEDSSGLPCLPPPARQTLPRSPYWATVSEIARRTPVLLDRETELDELVGFATGREGYRWLVAGPWAGKTGLVAHFLGSVPAGVDVVAYFLVRRAGADNSDRFLSEANDQLSRLLGEDTTVQQNAPEVTWQSLWQQAVDQAERTGRHLLLVVDGLDEDLSRSRGLPSVASLLPTLVGARAHVLVTSRPNPGVPSDVDIDHPLRTTPPSPLAPSQHARKIEARAYQELDEVLRHREEAGGKAGRARRVLSLFAAAEGPLSLRDLADLTGDKTWKLEKTVEDQLGRLLEPSAQGRLPRLMFAHETLRDSAAELFAGQELEQAQRRILEWAADQAAAGWSIDETPDFLLDSYPDLLTRHEPDRLGELTRDIAYLEALAGRMGIDQAATLLRSALATNDDTAATTLWVLDREAHNLRGWDPQSDRTRFASQVRNRAVELEVPHLAAAADARLAHLGLAHLALVWQAGVVSANLERTLLGHDFGSVDALALTHGGQRLISGGQDGALRVWDLETGRQLSVRQGHPYGITKVVAVADGRMAVSLSGDGGARVWDLEAWGELLAMEEVDDVEMTTEGWLFVALRSGVVEQRRPGSAELERRLSGGDHSRSRLGAAGSTVLAVNAGGGRVAAGYPDGSIRVWDLDTGATREQLGPGPVSALAFDPAGRLLVLGFATGVAQVWDLASGGDARTLEGHDEAVVGVAVANDARTAVTISIDGAMTSWDVGSGTSLNTTAADRAYQRGHGHPPLTLSSDGQLAVGALGWQSLTVMETRAGGSVRLLRGHTHSVWAAAMTPDDRRVVSGSGDGSIKLWNLTPDRAPAGLTGHSMGVEAVAISPDGEVAVSGSTDGTLKVWEVRNGKQRCALVAHDASIEGVSIDSAGRVGASVGLDSTIRTWDLRTGTQKAVLETDRSWDAVGIAENGTLALVAGNGAVMVWGKAGIREVRSGDRSTGIVLPCAVSQGGGAVVWATSDPGPGFTALDVAAGTSHAVVTDHSPQSVAVGPDGTFVAAGLTDGTVGVWNVVDQAEVARLVGHAYLVRAVAVGADGHVVSGAGDRTIRAWRTGPAQGPVGSGGQAVATAAVDSDVNSVAASADGSMIVVGEASGAVSCFRLILPGHASSRSAFIVPVDRR